jgi:hypothetical protein
MPRSNTRRALFINKKAADFSAALPRSAGLLRHSTGTGVGASIRYINIIIGKGNPSLYQYYYWELAGRSRVPLFSDKPRQGLDAS